MSYKQRSPIIVPEGGTGIITANIAYSVIVAGTTAAGAFQNTVSAGTAGQVLISAGAAAIPAWGNPGSTSIINVTPIDNTDSPYPVVATDNLIAVDSTTAAVTINLPNTPTNGSTWIVKDSLGQAVANNITVTTVGGVVLIDAAATFVINTAYEAIRLVFVTDHYEII